MRRFLKYALRVGLLAIGVSGWPGCVSLKAPERITIGGSERHHHDRDHHEHDDRDHQEHDDEDGGGDDDD